MTRSWTDDSVEHYFWTSERLGHKPDPDRKHKKPAEIFSRLKRLEEPLNHLLGLFCSLVSPAFVAGLFKLHCEFDIDEAPTFLGSDVQALCLADGATQPDFAFDAPSYFLTIEAKMDSKSSIEQAAKYALLHHRVNAQRPRKGLALLYLSRNAPHDLFPGKWEGWDSLKAHTVAALPSINKAAFRQLSDDDRLLVAKTLSRMRIGSMTFRDLSAAIASAVACAGSTEADGVVRRLYEGMQAELARRGLI